MIGWLENKLASHALKVAFVLVLVLVYSVHLLQKDHEAAARRCYESVCPEGLVPVLMSEKTAAQQCVCIQGARPVRK